MSANHNHESKNRDKNLKISILLNTLFTLFEFTVGLLTGSLALLSDSGHNLTDSLSLIISLFANKISERKANSEHTYGYGRATILAALINTTILILLSLFIFFEAYKRIIHPQPVEGTTIILVSLLGICSNLLIAFILKKHSDDLNIKSVFLNMALDALALGGTLIAGIAILITNQPVIDPLISVGIGILLLYGAWGGCKRCGSCIT